MFSGEKIVTHRERVICTLNHEEPDRVPIDYGSMLSTGIHVFAQRKLKCYLELKDTHDEVVDIHQQLAAPDPSIRKTFDADIYPVFALPSTKWSSKIVEEDDYAYWTDEWGTVYRKPKEGWWYDLYQFPLQNIDTISGLKRYKWPDPEDSGRIEGLAEKVRKIFQETDYAILVNSPYVGIFETGWYLRGMDNWLCDLVLRKNFAQEIIERSLQWRIKYWNKVLDQIAPYVHVVQIGDDLAGENSPLISPDLYRKFFKPAHRKLCDFIKSKAPVKVFIHSCGDIRPFLIDFVDVGIDILNPIQVSCKGLADTKKLKKEFGRYLTFWGGGCDTQRVLPFGNPEDVKKEVKRRINDLALEGGFVFCQVHNIQPEVPPENIVTMFQSAKEYGRYPINI